MVTQLIIRLMTFFFVVLCSVISNLSLDSVDSIPVVVVQLKEKNHSHFSYGCEDKASLRDKTLNIFIN